MQLPSEAQLLRVQDQLITVVRKLRYYAASEFKGLFEIQA